MLFPSQRMSLPGSSPTCISLAPHVVRVSEGGEQLMHSVAFCEFRRCHLEYTPDKGAQARRSIQLYSWLRHRVSDCMKCTPESRTGADRGGTTSPNPPRRTLARRVMMPHDMIDLKGRRTRNRSVTLGEMGDKETNRSVI